MGSCWVRASQPRCRSMVPVTVTATSSPLLVVSPELGCAWHSMDCVVRLCEDNQNPSSSSSCGNSTPEIAPTVPGRGGLSCCSSWSAASTGANLKAFSPCCGCCHRPGTERRCGFVGLQHRGSLLHGGRDTEQICDGGWKPLQMSGTVQRALSLLPSTCSWVPQVPVSSSHRTSPEPSSRSRR